MQSLKKIFSFSAQSGLYVVGAIGMLLLYFIGEHGEPFALCLLFALLLNGLNPPILCILYILTSCISLSVIKISVYAIGGAVLLLSFGISALCKRKVSFEGPIYLLLALLPFVFLFPQESYPIIDNLHPYLQRTIVALLIFLLSAPTYVAINALLEKTFRCRMKEEELLCVAVLLFLLSFGIIQSCGSFVYFGIATFLILLCLVTTEKNFILPFALLLSLPQAILMQSPPIMAWYMLYACAALLFFSIGKIPSALAYFTCYLAIEFYLGLYQMEVSTLIFSLLSCFIPCFAFSCLPSSFIQSMQKKLSLYREKHLTRIAINRSRTAVGEQLFEVSNLFRRIESCFTAIDQIEQPQAEEQITRELQKEMCSICANYQKCLENKVPHALKKLVSVGCSKGKVNFIDLPADLTARCINASGLLFSLNRQLNDYRKICTETETAKAGRLLLCEQAHGISGILKDIALEESAPLSLSEEKEKEVSAALAKNGILCSEILIYGEEDITVSLTTFGIKESTDIASAVSQILGQTMLVSEKIVLGGEKFCFILRHKPKYDAAFGISTVKKDKEKASGDTTSVLRIDEKRFLAALSDGMGSGESAKRVSENAISLLESFYRAKMPSDTILSTVNRLLSFSGEETFACVDLASVDLISGRADIVKIGSPMGFVFTQGSIRVLEGESLPIGMLETLHPTTLQVTMQEDDMLVFLSDGVTSAFGSSADLFEYLKNLNPHNPQTLADDLVKTSIERFGGKAKDDITVLAVRLFCA